MSRYFSLETWSDFRHRGGLTLIKVDVRWSRFRTGRPSWIELTVALLGLGAEVTVWPNGKDWT